jgi:hypothetical protein
MHNAASSTRQKNRVAIAEPTLPDVVRAIGVTVKKRSPDILLVVNLISEGDPETDRPRPSPSPAIAGQL